jgi:ribosome maturation factor RimP
VARAKDEVVLRLQQVVEPVLTSLGYECVLSETAVENGRKIVRIFIDRASPASEESKDRAVEISAEPIGIEDCVKVTRELDPVLDVADVIPGRFELEVSSPGINRPLARRQDFERFKGQKVAVRTYEKIGDRRNFLGTLLGMEGDEIRINVDGREHRVPFGEVSKANLDVL